MNRAKHNHTLSIIVPCYNEMMTIVEVLEKVKKVELPLGWGKEIVVVDDCSTDGSVNKIKNVPGIDKVICRNKNGGKGAAVKDGLREAKGDYCIVQDGDLELNPDEYPLLLEPIVKGDAVSVFGYRVFSSLNKSKNSVFFYGGRFLSLFYNLMFRTKFKDIPVCYKVFPSILIPKLLRTPSDDFVFDAVEMTNIIDRGGSVAQVPISYVPRGIKEGKKMRWQQGVYCLLAIFLLRLGIHRSPISKEAPKMFRFLITGITSLFANLIFIYLLTEYFNMWYLFSSMFSFAGSWVVNFTMHKFWTFGYEQVHSALFQLPLHFSLGLINLVINTLLMYLLVNHLHLWYVLAQIVAAGIIAVESFLIQSKFIFKEA